MTMTLEEMKERKRQLGYKNEQIAEWSSVPLSTVQKVFSGATQSPRYGTLRAIEEVLTDAPANASLMVRESVVKYGAPIEKKQGEYTVADYYAWPEDERIELIDGAIYDMGAPSWKHQGIVGEIFFALRDYVKRNKGQCRVGLFPIDVQLDGDNKTMVQPDVMIICKREQINKRNVLGAPDMAVEVLSKSTRQKDMTVKLKKYTEAGVREYWIVDPRDEKIIVYDLENDMRVTLYTFDNEVPVCIFDGKCVVDFREMKDYVGE